MDEPRAVCCCVSWFVMTLRNDSSVRVRDRWQLVRDEWQVARNMEKYELLEAKYNKHLEDAEKQELVSRWLTHWLMHWLMHCGY